MKKINVTGIFQNVCNLAKALGHMLDDKASSPPPSDEETFSDPQIKAGIMYMYNKLAEQLFNPNRRKNQAEIREDRIIIQALKNIPVKDQMSLSEISAEIEHFAETLGEKGIVPAENAQKIGDFMTEHFVEGANDKYCDRRLVNSMRYSEKIGSQQTEDQNPKPVI